MKSIKLATLVSVLGLSAGVAMANPSFQAKHDTNGYTSANNMHNTDNGEFRTIRAYQGKR